MLTEHPEADVFAAVSKCVALRAFNADAIESALRNAPLNLPSSRLDLSDRPELASVGNGIRLAAEYDVLLESQRDSDADSAADADNAADSDADSKSNSLASRRASAPEQETLVDEPVVDDRGADAAPLAKTFASLPDALALCCSQDTLCCSEVEVDPVPLPRKEDAA